MFCRKCGQEIKSGAKFCVKCGTAVPAQPQQKKSGKGLIIVLICVIVIALAAVVGLIFFYHTLDQDASKENDETIEEELEKDEKDSHDESEEVIKDNDTEADEVVKGTESVANDTQDVARETEAALPEAQGAEEKEHEYKIVVKDVSWTEAYQEAKSVSDGYLVNIDSEEEWNRILQLIQTEQRENCIFWIGAIRRGDSEDYFWVDADGNSVGDSLNQSSNWLSGEPTFFDAENNIEERYVEMFFYSKENRWVWNDTPDDLISLLPNYSGKIAYIVEIENE